MWKTACFVLGLWRVSTETKNWFTREHRRDKGRLEYIRLYANNVKTIIDGVTFDEFVSDIRIYYSVMKKY